MNNLCVKSIVENLNEKPTVETKKNGVFCISSGSLQKYIPNY